MYSKATILSALVALAEARFGQEQTPVAAVSALGAFGKPGDSGTLAGGVPGVLLAAANPCAKLQLADKIVATLGTDAQVVSAAAALVGAEQNFNPFVVSVPNICGDATLPTTAALRGIVPLIDPAVVGSDKENANAAASLKTPFAATGMSVADVMKAQGFSNFTIAGGAAGAGGAGAGGAAGSAAGGSKATSAPAAVATSAPAAVATPVQCGGAPPAASSAAAAAPPATNTTTGGAGSGAGAATGGAGAVTNAVTGNFPGFQASSLGLDFGTCTPTIKFEESLNGRKAGEFTFQAQDPVVNKGQQEALNPNIIMNRICDQLRNVCGAPESSFTTCKTTQGQLGGGAKDATTADKWNSALGFAGVDINPDQAPKAGLVGHT